MTLATLDSPQLSYSAVPTRGAGPEAHFIAKQSEEGRRRLRETHSLGLGADRAFEELLWWQGNADRRIGMGMGHHQLRLRPSIMHADFSVHSRSESLRPPLGLSPMGT